METSCQSLQLPHPTRQPSRQHPSAPACAGSASTGGMAHRMTQKPGGGQAGCWPDTLLRSHNTLPYESHKAEVVYLWPTYQRMRNTNPSSNPTNWPSDGEWMTRLTWGAYQIWGRDSVHAWWERGLKLLSAIWYTPWNKHHFYRQLLDVIIVWAPSP